MNANDLLKYFGLPVTNQAFNDFLSSNGIHERPEYDPESGIPFALLRVPAAGFFMEFIKPLEFAENFGTVREDGELIFSQVFLYMTAEDDYNAYRGTWPGAVPESASPDAFFAKLGNPDFFRDEDDDFGQANTIEYTWDRANDYSIFVRFTKKPLAVRHIVITPAKV